MNNPKHEKKEPKKTETPKYQKPALKRLGNLKQVTFLSM